MRENVCDRLLLRLREIEPSAAFGSEDRKAMEGFLKRQTARMEAEPENAAAIQTEVEKAWGIFLDGRRPLCNFHIISDLHISGDKDRSRQYLMALGDMADLWPETAAGMVNVGDFTAQGRKAQYEEFYQLTGEYKPVSDENTLILLGNHDVRGPDPALWNKYPKEDCPYWETAKRLYQTLNARYLPEGDKSALYHKKVLSGYTFLMMNTEKGLKDAPCLSEEQIRWLEENLKACWEEDPDKPVFLISHQPFNNTHWRSNILDGFDGWSNQRGTGPTGAPQEYNTRHVDQRLKEILRKYPVGVMLSGHIHNQFGQVELQLREYGAALDLPSFAEPEIGIPDVGTGFELALYPEEVVFRARNFVTGQWLPQYDQRLPLPALPVVHQRAQQKQQSGEASPALLRAMEEAGEWMNRSYDQEGLPWNHLQPPAKRLFDRAALHRLEELRRAMLSQL